MSEQLKEVMSTENLTRSLMNLISESNHDYAQTLLDAICVNVRYAGIEEGMTEFKKQILAALPEGKS